MLSTLPFASYGQADGGKLDTGAGDGGKLDGGDDNGDGVGSIVGGNVLGGKVGGDEGNVGGNVGEGDSLGGVGGNVSGGDVGCNVLTAGVGCCILMSKSKNRGSCPSFVNKAKMSFSSASSQSSTGVCTSNVASRLSEWDDGSANKDDDDPNDMALSLSWVRSDCSFRIGLLLFTLSPSGTGSPLPSKSQPKLSSTKFLEAISKHWLTSSCFTTKAKKISPLGWAHVNIDYRTESNEMVVFSGFRHGRTYHDY
jgi:hypothetical protein